MGIVSCNNHSLHYNPGAFTVGGKGENSAGGTVRGVSRAISKPEGEPSRCLGAAASQLCDCGPGTHPLWGSASFSDDGMPGCTHSRPLTFSCRVLSTVLGGVVGAPEAVFPFTTHSVRSAVRQIPVCMAAHSLILRGSHGVLSLLVCRTKGRLGVLAWVCFPACQSGRVTFGV